MASIFDEKGGSILNPEHLISCALDIGEHMLICGAEVGRVEDSMKLICTAYGCKRVDAFTITSSIIVSLITNDDKHITQTRRITGGQTNLTKVHKLNDLSRYICQEKPDYTYVHQKISEICSEKPFPLWLEALASALIAAAFTMFFGGTMYDGVAAIVLGLLTRYVTFLLEKVGMNQVFVNVAATFALCLTAAGLTGIGIGQDPDKMIIGTIMLLIPGVGLTNSLRDMISGEIMSGLLRFFNSLLVAAAIAAGYILAGHVLGGAL